MVFFPYKKILLPVFCCKTLLCHWHRWPPRCIRKKKHERAKVPCVEKSSCWKDVLYGHIWNFFKSGLIKVGKWGIKICCKKWTFCKKEESLKKVKGSINIFANFTLDCMFKDNFILVQQGLLPNSKQQYEDLKV